MECDSLASFFFVSSCVLSLLGMVNSIVEGLLSEVQSMKKVMSSISISTIGVKSTRTVIFFCLLFFSFAIT